MDIITILIVAGIILYVIFLFWIAYRIIIDYDDCNPIKASSWIFVITFIPILGLLWHIVFGRNLRKRRSLYELLRNEVDTSTIDNFSFRQDEASTLPTHYLSLKKLLTKLSHLPVFPGNTIDFYSTGEEKFDHLFKDIEQAKDHVHILYYTFGGDETGQKFRDVIIKKRKEGVKVRLIYDDVGSDKTKKRFFRELEKEGIEVTIFSPVFLPKARVLQRVNYRNHRKIVVIDGKIAYTGGMNVKNEYVMGISWGIWRDLSFRIDGPAAQGLQAIFIIDWHYCTRQFLNSKQFFPQIQNTGTVPIQIVGSEPLGKFRSIMFGMFHAISQAKKRILIQTPYFVPTASIMASLQSSALSGVEIIMTLPYRSDNAKVQYASNSYIQQLLDCGIRIYRYKPGFIHSKLMIIDDELIIAGSSNMDVRSFELNFEDCVFIYDKETASKALEIYNRDLNDCELLVPIEWAKRSKIKKFQDAFFRLFSPFL